MAHQTFAVEWHKVTSVPVTPGSTWNSLPFLQGTEGGGEGMGLNLGLQKSKACAHVSEGRKSRQPTGNGLDPDGCRLLQPLLQLLTDILITLQTFLLFLGTKPMGRNGHGKMDTIRHLGLLPISMTMCSNNCSLAYQSARGLRTHTSGDPFSHAFFDTDYGSSVCPFAFTHNSETYVSACMQGTQKRYQCRLH